MAVSGVFTEFQAKMEKVPGKTQLAMASTESSLLGRIAHCNLKVATEVQQLSAVEHVVVGLAFLFDLQDALLHQLLEMLRNRGLGQWHALHQIAEFQPIVIGKQQCHSSDAGWVCHRLRKGSKLPFGVIK